MLWVKFYLKEYVFKFLILAIFSIFALITVFCFVPEIQNRNGASAEVAEEVIKLPILMYHGLTENSNHENKFVINVGLFESDLEYLTQNGFNTIFIRDLIDFVYNDGILPEKPIMITFDDGYRNNYFYAFPLIKKYECKMIFSPIGKCIDDYTKIQDKNIKYSHSTWPEIKEMVDSGLVEVQNHSYDMHSCKKRKGCKKVKSESKSSYEKFFKSDVLKFQEECLKNLGTAPTAFVYPFGAMCNESEELLHDLGFKVTVSCEGKINFIRKKPNSLYKLRRFIRPNKISTKKFFKKITTN
ncbi:MAG: polysaccharide deacetylase family protein [Oscillospiraceae bacterium]|jgi:peptidoglycan/xylan/chitin deacetylase (PgdA/CDA1 family)|nr:polysaccharide deacetylase family protein [Oscillospiraceae bacterium]